MWKSPGINGDVTDSLTSLLINNNTFDSIHGTNQGRCIFIIRTNNNRLEINNNTIQNCPSGGTLIKVECKTTINSFQIDSCKFIKNAIDSEYDLIGPAPLFWIQDSTDGGDHIHPFDFTFSNCYFESNSNNRKGGGLNCGGIRYVANVKLILDNCEFIDNHAHEDGGGVNIQVYQGCEIKSCKFIRNKSDEGCGSIYFETDFQCLKDSWEDKNGVLPVPSTRDLTISITNSYFEGNIGKGSHGIRIKNSVNVKIDILECNFINCGTNDYVISIETDIQANNIKNCTFDYTTDQTSCGIYHFNDKLKLIGNSFLNFKETVIRLPLEHNLEFQLIENNFSDCQNCYLLYIERIATYCPTIKGNNFDYFSGNGQIFYIRFNDDIESITIENNTFSSFVSSSEFGGIGLDISHENNNILLSFVLNDCVFKNDTNTKIGGVIYFGQNSGNAAVTLNHCFFIKNYNNDKGSSIYYNSKNGITIDNCFFSENSGLVDGVIYIEQNYQSDTTSEITIENCHFEQNKGKESTIYLANGQTKTVKIELCDFEQDYGGIYTNDFNNKVEIINNIFYKTSEKAALIINSPTKSENTITVKDCRFDSCSGSENQCFNIVVNTKQFSFLDNFVQNNKGTGCSNYFGTIDCCGEITSLDIINISFINNSGNSLYGGGIGLQFINIQQLTFDNCKFISNEAQQDTSISRPTKDSKSYYNGDGGGFQIGYSCLLNDVNLQFQNCKFINNRAYRHGGAISIQTIGFVKIIGCMFENNTANCLSDSSKLLIDNYFDKKSEGRGGALYINPSYTYDDSQCNSPDHYMSNVDIIESEFKNNNAYDGYGIYFEGDDPGQNFIINIADNIFTDNYNEKNHNDDIYSIFGAVITTEILKVTEKQINDDNIFNYTITEIKVRNVSVVDHAGKTPTYAFTLSDAFTKSDPFPSNNFTLSQFFSYSSKFTESKEFSNSHLFSNSNEFSSSKQFSETSSFTNSNIFSSSNLFSESNLFSNSGQFSNSDIFSNSNKFTSSKQFTETNVFSSSNVFSNSKFFTKSIIFSSSEQFSKSNSFSNSVQFSRSNMFSNSDQFSKSDLFSNSITFSKTDIFSKSIQFSSSNYFSNSNQFSETQSFSYSVLFSKSNEFSQSSLFSQTQLFTESKQFSETISFTQSNMFSKSDQFTNTNLFSHSIKFTNSLYFSKTGLFSQSKDFTKSRLFSQSAIFSVSNQFSNSHSFTNSKYFSNSKQFSQSGLFSESNHFTQSNPFNTKAFEPTEKFSESASFTMSELFKEPKCILYEEDGNVTILPECNYSMNNGRPVFVKVISTNFTYMTNTINGTAIHIDNCGLLCNRTLFLDCVTTSGCGGAIYIRNDVDLLINITLESLIFKKCEAICGGAVFIYSHIDENEVLIKNCTFLSNKVHKSNYFNLFGGSAIYLASNNVDIADCSFRENAGSGGACKIESINNNNLKILQIDQTHTKIKISGCTFENDKKSDSSIFYLNENRSNLIQITQCSFKGKLKNGSNYIDGKTTDSEKIQVKDCDFDYELNKSINVSKWKKMIISAFIFLSSFILIIIKIIKWNKNKEEFNSQDLIDRFNENRNQLLNDL